MRSPSSEEPYGRPRSGDAIGPETSRGTRLQRRRLAYSAALRIGGSLDVGETAQALADVLVEEFADIVTVDLTDAVLLLGGEPRPLGARPEVNLRRVAVAATPGAWPAGLLPVRRKLPPIPGNDLMEPMMRGLPVLAPDIAELRAALPLSPDELDLIVPANAHSAAAVPLYARGIVLGTCTLWRMRPSPPFDDEDAEVLTEVTSLAAIGLDNARRYTREHRSAVMLQRSLLPRRVRDIAAAETAGVYVPAGGVGVGGDWFDVIPLSSLRVALVVGDVVGHGLGATAAMARLRTALQTLADQDPDPEELVSHLDDLVLHVVRDHEPEAGAAESDDPRDHDDADGRGSEPDVQAARCLYVVYDPVSGQCTMASAGHLPPVVVRPGAEPRHVAITPGPPLGVGGVPFEATTLTLPGGSLLGCYTDGLVAARGRDIDQGRERLRRRLGEVPYDDRPLTVQGPDIVSDLAASREDDATLLLVRTRTVPPENVRRWELPAEPAVVAGVRDEVARQLADWNLSHLAFTTGLVVSELVTNAVRHSRGPIRVCLVRDRVLVLEVSDPSNTHPRMRRARTTDENGRGLFLVGHLTSRWGCRYARAGKTVWTEQRLEGSVF